MDRQIDKWMDKQKSSCVLQDFVPYGAAAQKEERLAESRISSPRFDKAGIMDNLLGIGPPCWDFGLETEIWASK